MGRKAEIKKELREMKKVGMRVPPRAFVVLERTPLEELRGMTICEAADYIVALS